MPTRGILDALPDPVLACDEDGVVTFANAAARELLGEIPDSPADTWIRDERGLLWPEAGPEEKGVVIERLGAEDLRVRAVVAPAGEGWVIQLRAMDRAAGLRAVVAAAAARLEEELGLVAAEASQALLDAVDDHQRRRLRKVLGAAERAHRSQARLRALGGERSEAPVVALDTLLDDNLAALSATAGARLELDLPTAQVRVDPDALVLGLMDRLARRARLGASSFSLRGSISGSRLRLVLADDGPGALGQGEPELLDGVVEDAGGRVVGVGGALHFELPLASGAGARRERPRGSETVLVVEDDEVIRRWVQVTLESLGYSVLTAENGVSASVLMREQRAIIDLAIVDGMLPGRSGLEIIEEARRVDPQARLLLMTGYAAELGGLSRVPVLEKPFSPAELVDAVRRLLDGA